MLLVERVLELLIKLLWKVYISVHHLCLHGVVDRDTRTIVSGIAESFSPEDIIGQQVSVLVNLEPRKIRGVESQGMILMTDTPDGKLAFVEPERKVENGQTVS